MKPPAFAAEAPAMAAARLAEHRAAQRCVTYCDRAEFGSKGRFRLSILGVLPEREIFLEVTDGRTVRVRSFLSRLRPLPADLDQLEIPLVDMADAFQLARLMLRKWPRADRMAFDPLVRATR